MRHESWRIARLAITGAVTGLLVVLALDLLQPSAVMADVVDRQSIGEIGEQATVSWAGSDGVTLTAFVFIPAEYAHSTQVPLHLTQAPYVGDEWMARPSYLVGGLVGLVFGLLAAFSLHSQPYSEKPIRQVVPMAGT